MFLLSKLQAEFTNYMKIALKNDSIDYFRMNNKKGVIDLISIEDVQKLEVSVSQDSGIGTFSFDKFNIRDITDKRLFYAIENLTPRQQKIIFLYADGISLSEISKELNISKGTVKATIFQVKEKIKKYMEEY